MANYIKDAFLSRMSTFKALLLQSTDHPTEKVPPLQVSVISVFKKLLSMNPTKETGQDMLYLYDSQKMLTF